MEGKSQGTRATLLQLLKSRWMMAVVSFYILFCSGGTYIFGIYSGAIKESLHYNQETIDTLSFFKDLGANVGIISGLLNEVMPSWVVLAVGAVMNLFGYLMIWLAVTHRIARPPTSHMYLFLCLGANSQTFANTGVLVTFVKNFPKGRGEVLGIIKGCVGLSGAIFTQIYLAIYGEDSRGVILLLGWLPSLITLLLMFFIRPMTPVHDKRETRTFYHFLYLALLLAGFLMFAIILENELPHIPSFAYKACGAITLILVISNIIIGIRAENAFKAQVEEQASTKSKRMQELSATANKQILVKGEERKASLGDGKPSSNSHLNHETHTDSHENPEVKLQEGVNSVANPGSPVRSKDINSTSPSKAGGKPRIFTKLKLFFKNRPERGEDFNIPQAILSTDMWILFISITCGVGATLAAIDNMGQIGESQGYEKKTIKTFVSLISIWNFLGRVMAGFISEILLRRYRFPRTLVLTIVLAVACVGHLLIAFPTRNSLYIASIVVGLCFGAQWPLLYAIVSELFGLKYYATLYNVGALASPLGSYLLNVRVAGYLYDREALRQQEALLLFMGAAGAPPPSSTHADLKCMGTECFKLTFLIMTMVSAFGSLVSVLLVLRTKKFYGQDIYSKFHLNSDNEANQQEPRH